MPTIPEQIAEVQHRWAQRAAAPAESREHPAVCEAQAPRVVWDGLRRRSASLVMDDEVVHVPELVCRRLRCQRCGLRWTRRPAGCLPRRHYQPCVLESAVAEVALGGASQTVAAERLGVDRRTVSRWTHWTAHAAEPAALQHELLEASDEPTVVGTPAVALRREPGGSRSSVCARAAHVLALCVALASALALPPPELGAVMSHYAGPLDRASTDRAPAIASLTIPEDARGAVP